MRTTQANRYARGSATLALLLACFVSGVYIRHAWQNYKLREAIPSAVPSAVQQQAAEFSFSKEDGDHPEFTMRASHATEFAEGGRSLLQDVWVTFYGEDGSRADNLHTRSCEMLDSAGTILCAGDVQIDLQSAADARQFPSTPDHPNAGAHIMHIHTSHVSFDRGTGMASSDQAVIFEFPEGHGNALGLRYDSHEEELQLLHKVDLNFVPAAPATSAGAEKLPVAPLGPGADANQMPLHVIASSLEYRRSQRVINLQGPVDAQQGQRRLTAGHVAVELDLMLQAHRIVASAKPRLESLERPGDNITIAADQFSVELSPQGWVERILATGSVHADSRSADRDDRLDAARIEMAMVDGKNQPRTLTASQDVVAQSDSPGGVDRRLATSRLDLQFAPDSGDGQLHLNSATTPAATLDWHIPADGATKTPAERMHLSSQRLDADFGPGGDVREVRGNGGVEIERQISDSGPQTSTSRQLVARLVPSGDWSSLDLTGAVNLRQADQLARADSAHFDRLTDTATLKGSIALSNPRYRLTARSATFAQQTNEFHAEGEVVSSEVAAQSQLPAAKPAAATNLAPAPARITANRLDLNTETGHAVYSDTARLWQGTSLIEADRIELDRTTQTLAANGHVRAVFPQAPFKSTFGSTLGALDPVAPASARTKTVAQTTTQATTKTQGKASAAADKDRSEFMRTEAGRLVYRSAEDRAVLDQGVISHSSEGSIQSDAMDLYFAASGNTPGTAVDEPPDPAKGAKSVIAVSDPPAGAPQGPRQLVRATALGHVMVQVADRRATANQADYAYAEGKFVLSGGAPTVRDSSGNSASGRQLTLFFADDRIVIDSAEGMRTVTLHRVEK